MLWQNIFQDVKLLLAARKGDKDREPRISELSPEDKFKLLENNMVLEHGPYAVYIIKIRS